MHTKKTVTLIFKTGQDAVVDAGKTEMKSVERK